MSSARDRLKQLLAKAKVAEVTVEGQPNFNNPSSHPGNRSDAEQAKVDMLDERVSGVVYNEKQQEFVDTVANLQSCILTGAAGSGKTTSVRGAVTNLIQKDLVGTFQNPGHKWIRSGTPSIVAVSFTNKAVENIKKAMPKHLHPNCMTIHKLLEYEPVEDEVWDEEQGKFRRTMTFEPKRCEEYRLPYIEVLFIDEATMVSADLWNKLAEAIHDWERVTIVLIGDIQQLPPVFGKSIFIHGMQSGAKTIELTEIYRQALESPIISLAHTVKEGKMIPAPKLADYTIDAGEQGKVTIHPWKKKLSDLSALNAMRMFLPNAIDSGAYNPVDDVILTPYNKSFGTIEINKIVATHLAKIEDDPAKKEVWEIFAGIHKKYFRIGDKVLHNKTEAFITNIERNKSYYGKQPRHPSDTMDYTGAETDSVKRVENIAGFDDTLDIDGMLESFSSHTEDSDAISRAASHKVTVYIPDLDQTQELSSSGAINALDLGYALTVHKSQGSEYNRVFFVTHKSQSNMWFRELLYTGITRAAKELYIICEPNFFVKGVTTQRVPGNTLEQKIESFERLLSTGKFSDNERPIKMHLLTGESTVVEEVSYGAQ